VAALGGLACFYAKQGTLSYRRHLLAACAHAQSMPTIMMTGEVRVSVFPTSCAARSQGAILRGVALLHSFGYTEAQMQFEAIAKDDPACAMAHWGIAMTQFQSCGGSRMRRFEAGRCGNGKGRALAAPPAATTPREMAYIGALSAFFDPAATSFQQRANAYESKMNALHAAFPEECGGAAFDALSMLRSVAPDILR